MALDIMGLFNTQSVNPYQQQQQAFQQNLMRSTNPQQFVATLGTNMGGQIAGAIPGMFGIKSEEEKKNQAKKEALAEVQSLNIDPTDKLAVGKALVNALQSRGLTAEAMQVGQSLEKGKDVKTQVVEVNGKKVLINADTGEPIKDIGSVTKDVKTQVVEVNGKKVLINELTGEPIKDIGSVTKDDKTQVVNVNGKQVLINADTGAVIKVIGDAPKPAGTTIVNQAETSEQKAYGTSLQDTYNRISEAAATSSKTKVAFETQLGSLNKGFETGFGTEFKAAAASVLGAMGVKDAKDFATNAQVFKAAASSAILTKQLEQKGPQTQSDADMIRDTGAKLGNTKEANIFLAQVGIAQANRDIEQRKFFREWRTKNKTFDGAEEAWIDGEGGKSLFDRPELKKYKQKANLIANIPDQGGTQTAPMYAVNPQTNQRIVSTDGGKTWQETR